MECNRMEWNGGMENDECLVTGNLNNWLLDLVLNYVML